MPNTERSRYYQDGCGDIDLYCRSCWVDPMPRSNEAPALEPEPDIDDDDPPYDPEDDDLEDEDEENEDEDVVVAFEEYIPGSGAGSSTVTLFPFSGKARKDIYQAATMPNATSAAVCYRRVIERYGLDDSLTVLRYYKEQGGITFRLQYTNGYHENGKTLSPEEANWLIGLFVDEYLVGNTFGVATLSGVNWGAKIVPLPLTNLREELIAKLYELCVVPPLDPPMTFSQWTARIDRLQVIHALCPTGDREFGFGFGYTPRSNGYRNSPFEPESPVVPLKLMIEANKILAELGVPAERGYLAERTLLAEQRRHREHVIIAAKHGVPLHICSTHFGTETCPLCLYRGKSLSSMNLETVLQVLRNYGEGRAPRSMCPECAKINLAEWQFMPRKISKAYFTSFGTRL